jgi:hypothetical protein
VNVETIVGGIVVAGLGGLTFFAYKHPAGFNVLAPWLVGIPAGVVVVYGIWQAAALNLWVSLMNLIPPGSDTAAAAAYERFSQPSWWIIALIYCAWTFYVIFLAKLPYLTSIGDAGGQEGADEARSLTGTTDVDKQIDGPSDD